VLDFELLVQGSGAQSAEVYLCNSHSELERQGEGFRGTREFSCEGSGGIVVHYEDQTTAWCSLGYVTVNMSREMLRYVIDERRVCRPVRSGPAARS
jgi:hypothetical protein